MASLSKPDFILLGVSVVLIILGILILASVSASISQGKFGNTFYYLNHQLIFGIIPGLILGFFAFRIRLGLLKKWAPLLLLINLILLAMVFLPKIGTTFLGATRWLNLGPIAFQPSEFLKLTFILYLASWLSARTFRQTKFGDGQTGKEFSQTLIAFLIVIAVIGLFLYYQPDISTLSIIILVGAVMYFLAGTPFWHIVLLFLIISGSLLSLAKLAPYRANRLLVFLKPETDPMGIGYQIQQALIAVGSGGVFGQGLGMSHQKFGFLPHPMSDSIFAVFAEEAGFIGSLLLILFFLTFLWQGFKIGKSSQDKFSQLLAYGITSWLLIQVLINIGSMIGILPLTGVPLPFISYGGSALISELIGVGILLNISKNK